MKVPTPEVDHCHKVLNISVTSRTRFQRLHNAVDTLQHAVTDPGACIIHNATPMAFHGFCSFHNRLQFAMCSPEIPFGEIRTCSIRIRNTPESSKTDLNVIRPHRLQIHVL